ncbi:YfbU family protein [Staphylococcus equorum]|uniref:YfbU family protein n=1 Tax=Staphylococcus equorum TaxID=246432 RepID=UPI0024086DC0|nr:YfbU family protein [Staphylococcus equorum]MDG0843149.1 YfbU family protein [Staphylococcus equorum]
MAKMSDQERLSLLNQFKILKTLNSDEDYSVEVKVLEEGLEAFYDDILFDGLNDAIDESKQEFVSKVLRLYRDAIFSYEKLNDAEKEDTIKNKIQFYGFDLNDVEQIDYMKVAEFYLYSLDRYKEIRDQIEGRSDDLNSHGFGPSMNTLKKYISTQDKIRQEKAASETLSKHELEEIFE